MTMIKPDRCCGIIVVKIYRYTVDETLFIFRKCFGKLAEERIAGRLVLMNPDVVGVRSFIR